MTMTIFENWAKEIADLTNEIVAIKTGLGDFAYFDGHETLQRKEERRAHLVTKHQWATGLLATIRRMVGDRPSLMKVSARRGRFDAESEQYIEGFDELYRRLSRNNGDPGRLFLELAKQSGLTAEQLASLDLVEPSDPAFVARAAAERKERRDFELGFEELRANVKAYAQKQNQSVGWAERDFLGVWNKGSFSKDERGLLAFARTLGERKLLPIADRFATSGKELLAKIKGVLA